MQSCSGVTKIPLLEIHGRSNCQSVLSTGHAGDHHGALGLVAMFRAPNGPGFLWSTLTAALTLIVGVLLLWRPVLGVVALALVALLIVRVNLVTSGLAMMMPGRTARSLVKTVAGAMR